MNTRELFMSTAKAALGTAVVVGGLLLGAVPGFVSPAEAQQQKPNILVIMGDDIGWFNIGAYRGGIMAGKTPNLDKLASEGMMFTDYYAKASCTAGRAAFITGELPIRTGMTTVGQAGATVGIPDQAVTIAQVLRPMGYTTGQLVRTTSATSTSSCRPRTGSMSSSATFIIWMRWRTRSGTPTRQRSRTGWTANLVHSYATTTDDPTVQPRWGKVGGSASSMRAHCHRTRCQHQVQHGDIRRGHPRLQRSISSIGRSRPTSRFSSG